MKKIVLKIKANDIKYRNEMHLEVQKNNRSQVVESKKAYKRQNNKNVIKRELKY